MATVWRWPPESEAIGSRTLGIRAASSESSVQARTSIATSSSCHRVDLVAEEQVRDHVEVLAEREVLVDGGDPKLQCVARAGHGDRLAAEADLAGGRRVHAGEHLDQRRLARAVVADERDDLAGMDVEVDVGQRRDGAEVLADAAQAEDQLAGGGGASFDADMAAGSSSRLLRGARRPPGDWPGGGSGCYLMPSSAQPSA